MDKKISYNEAISKLDENIRKMQSNECSIDDLSTLTADSLELLKLCKDKLTKTDEQLKKILAELSDDNA